MFIIGTTIINSSFLGTSNTQVASKEAKTEEEGRMDRGYSRQ